MINALLLFAIALLSALLAFFFKDQARKSISAILSFSGAYLLSICFLHLLPELFQNESEYLGVFILLGFFLQLILDYFSGGIEHGHTHVNHKRIGKFPLLVLLSLCLHAFLESIPIHHIDNQSNLGEYLIALLIHKAPIAFILSSLLIAYKLSKTKIITGILLFAAVAPLGLYFGSSFEISSIYFQNLWAISVGIILHLSTTILLETNEEHKIHWKKVLPMVLGACMALLSLAIH